MQIYGEKIKYIKSELLSKYTDISHGFTLRGNDFMHADINSSTFTESKRKMAEELNIETNNLYFLNQVHDKNILKITENTQNEIKEYDALATNAKNKVLATCFADCVPVLLFDSKQKVVSSIHSGWKGTVKQIAKNTIEFMIANYNSQPNDIIAVIGPSIGPCCFQVNTDVKEQFVSIFGEKVINENKVDLWGANKIQLINCGVKEKNIECLNICTCCNNHKFYSYRKGDKEAGRFTAFIMLK